MVKISYTIIAKSINENIFGELTINDTIELEDYEFEDNKDDLESYILEECEASDTFDYNFYTQVTITNIEYSDYADDEIDDIASTIEDLEDRLAAIKKSLEDIKKLRIGILLEKE